MLIENLTDRNISIFTGVVVPANGSLPVDAGLEEKVKTSPLVNDYVAAKRLRLVVPKAVKPEPVLAAKAEPQAKTED